MKVLPDTSVWVDYLRRGQDGEAARLDDLLATEQVVVCGPIAAELVAGVAESARGELWQLLSSLPWATLEREEWRRVGEVAGALRSVGATVPLTNIQIAVAAASGGHRLWTRDSDFDRVAAVLDLARFLP